MPTTIDFPTQRKIFRAAMARHGMDEQGAGYCISVAKRLRKLYASADVLGSALLQRQEAEALTALGGFLGRVRSTGGVYDAARDEMVNWSYVVGGLDEGDSTVLYIVPPLIQPCAVPLPPLAQTDEQYQEYVRKTDSEVQKILDAWNRERPNEKPVTLDEVKERAVQVGTATATQMEYAKAAHDWWKNSSDESGVIEMGTEQHKLLEKLFKEIDARKDKAMRHAMSFGGVPIIFNGGSGFDFGDTSRYEKTGTATAQRIEREAHLRRLDRMREELHQKSIALGWSAELRKTELYAEFIECMVAVRQAMEQQDRAAEERYKERGRGLCKRLQEQHEGETRAVEWDFGREATAQRSIDHLREKEHSKHKRRNKY